jgi:hypothetical protein
LKKTPLLFGVSPGANLLIKLWIVVVVPGSMVISVQPGKLLSDKPSPLPEKRRAADGDAPAAAVPPIGRYAYSREKARFLLIDRLNLECLLLRHADNSLFPDSGPTTWYLTN